MSHLILFILFYRTEIKQDKRPKPTCALAPLLIDGDIDHRLHAFEMLAPAPDDVLAKYAAQVTASATGGSGQIRDVAVPLLDRIGMTTVVHLRALAVEAKPEQRRHALQLTDRTLGTAGFDERGKLTLSYDDRTFTAQLLPIDPRQDLRDWEDLLQAAGVRESRLHDARHTAATFLLLQGVDPRVVMDLMGWSTVTMLKRYQHVIDTLRRDAARRMGEFLYGPTTAATRDASTGDRRADGRRQEPN